MRGKLSHSRPNTSTLPWPKFVTGVLTRDVLIAVAITLLPRVNILNPSPA